MIKFSIVIARCEGQMAPIASQSLFTWHWVVGIGVIVCSQYLRCLFSFEACLWDGIQMWISHYFSISEDI